MQILLGRTALVTGGASGIGFGMALAFLEQGMNVVIADIRPDHLESAAATLGGRHDVLLLQLDVTDRGAMQRVADRVEARFGKLHVLCNNAGVGIFSNALEATYDDWDWGIEVNLTGVFNGMHAFLPLICKHGEGGHIVNTASISAALPIGMVYAAAKCGVLGMTEGVAGELATKNIGVTCLMPGPVRSNIHEVGKLRPVQYADTKQGAFEAELAKRSAPAHWMDPIVVGRMVVDAIRHNLLYVFTHREFRDGVEKRFAAMLAAMSSAPCSDEEKQRIGFPVENPIHDRLLTAAPASGDLQLDPRT
jgi:NAD(P)-dependent dehydrogenase (short-subunit alcohol dehydrogenase family)